MPSFFKKKPKGESREAQIRELDGYPQSHNIVNGIDCDEIPEAQGEFGRSPFNPIPVNGPVGEIKYLARLRLHGNPTMFHRLTTTAHRSAADEPVDIYELCGSSGEHWDILYLHMYHPRRSEKIPSRYSQADYHPEYSRLPVGLGTNSFIRSFPYYLGAIIEEYYGVVGKAVGLSRVYDRLFQDDKQYVRPVEHFIRVLQVNNAGNFFKELITFVGERYPNSYLIDLLGNADRYANVAALEAIIAKGEDASECLKAVIDLDFRTKDDSVSELIGEALRSMSPQVVSGIPLLIKGLYDQEQPERFALAYGTLRAFGYLVLPFIKPLLVDDDPRVREVARQLSTEIHDKKRV
jgi:hypothetical protein